LQKVQQLVRNIRGAIRAQHDVVAPLPQQQRQAACFRASAVDSEGPAAVLPPVAIRADVHAVPEELFDARDGRKLVDNPGCDKEGARVNLFSIDHRQEIVPPFYARHRSTAVRNGIVPRELRARRFEQLGWRDAAVAHVAMQGRGPFVAVSSAVDHQDAAHATT
jgi:hypothetical protein